MSELVKSAIFNLKTMQGNRVGLITMQGIIFAPVSFESYIMFILTIVSHVHSSQIPLMHAQRKPIFV